MCREQGRERVAADRKKGFDSASQICDSEVSCSLKGQALYNVIVITNRMTLMEANRVRKEKYKERERLRLSLWETSLLPHPMTGPFFSHPVCP